MLFHIKRLYLYQEDNLDEILDGIRSTNQNKAPKSFIGDYAVLELLGTGGFGSVYKVKKKKIRPIFSGHERGSDYVAKTLCLGIPLILPSNTPVM